MSNKHSLLRYYCYYSSDGVTVYKLIDSRHCTSQDRFYCEQAIWERISRHYERGLKMVYEFSGSGESGTHGELLPKGNFVKLHLLPQEFPISHLIFPIHELVSEDNVLKFSKANLDSPRLADFRLEWFSLGQPGLTAQVAKDKAESVKKKYADFFES